MHNEDTDPISKEELLKAALHIPVVHAPVSQDVCDLLNSLARKRPVYLRVITSKRPQTIATYILEWITPYRGSVYKVKVHDLPYDIYLHSPIPFELNL